jgi:putative transposase
MDLSKPLYHRRRFPAEIISHCVWLYFRFCLSYRDVEAMMAERGICRDLRNHSRLVAEVWRNLRQASAVPHTAPWRSLASRRSLSLDQCQLQYLWRAVDQDGEVLDILVQPVRNRQAAKNFFRKLLQRLQYIPRGIITDKLGSCAAAKAEVFPGVEHIQDKRLNNRAENSHQPTRERERRMRGFKSAGHAQRFLATFGVIATFFRPGRHLLGARNYREVMRRRFRQWGDVINPGFVSQ